MTFSCFTSEPMKKLLLKSVRAYTHLPNCICVITKIQATFIILFNVCFSLWLWSYDLQIYLSLDHLTKISRVKSTWTLNVREGSEHTLNTFLYNLFVFMTKTHLFRHSFLKVKRSSSYHHRRNIGNYSFMFPDWQWQWFFVSMTLFTNTFIYDTAFFN